MSYVWGPLETAASTQAVNGSQQHGLPNAFLRAGDIFGAARPSRLATILGSCVSTCIFDAVGGIGGMNHFVLPRSGPCEDQIGHHGDVAIHGLVKMLLSLGAERRYLRAKVFGGGIVLPSRHGCARKTMDIGRQNVREAFHTLRQLRVPIEAECVQQSCGLSIEMLTSTGAVQVRRLDQRPSR